jgi:CheY-like chemotaxis protein
LEKTTGNSNAHPIPILVLLDLQLPHVRGLDVLKWIRGQTLLRTMIVVIHSSSHLDIDIARAYQSGANSFLVKSSSASELARMMKLVKEYWLELNASVSSDPTASP